MTGPGDPPGTEPPPADTRLLRVSGPVHEQLAAIQAQMQAERRRRVTFSEVIEQLLQTWEQHHENR